MDDPVSGTPRDSVTRLGMIVAGAGSAAAGVLNLIWGEFESAHQPIQAWGDHIARIPILAYIAALWLILGGAALAIRRTAQVGAAALAILYAIFAVFPLPRVITAPHFLGYHVTVYIGLFVGIGQQLILFVPVAVLYASLSRRAPLSSAWTRAARWTFGLCSLDFGLVHLTGIQGVAPMVPVWMPLGGTFWTVITGIAFLLAGISIISGFRDVLAAKLLGLMLLVFSALVLTPGIFAAPHEHVAWGGNAYNLTAVGCAWIFAGWLAICGQGLQSERQVQQAFPSTP